MSTHEIRCRVNGAEITRSVDSRMLLSDFIRHDLRLTGTHVGCEHGVCGACTILLDGAAVRSCLTFAVQIDGKSLLTVEGLDQSGEIAALQQAFQKHHALQCGFCTPGILNTLHAALGAEPNLTKERCRELISGNICRCTGYVAIVDAAMDASAAYRSSK